MTGRELNDLKKTINKAVDALERSATANEQLLELATKEQLVSVEPGPPVCPWCGRVDPEITETGNGGSGTLSGFIVMGETHCCNHTIIAVPIGFDTFQSVEQAQAVISEKGRMTNGQ